MKMFKVYVIKSCEKNYLYVGMTNNFERRFNQHNSGRERTTRSYAPFKMVLIESFNARLEARQREKYLKSGVGKEYIKKEILKLT